MARFFSFPGVWLDTGPPLFGRPPAEPSLAEDLAELERALERRRAEDHERELAKLNRGEPFHGLRIVVNTWMPPDMIAAFPTNLTPEEAGAIRKARDEAQAAGLSEHEAQAAAWLVLARTGKVAVLHLGTRAHDTLVAAIEREGKVRE